MLGHYTSITLTIKANFSNSSDVLGIDNILFKGSNVNSVDTQGPIAFDEYPIGTVLTDEYKNNGVLFNNATLQDAWDATVVGVWENVTLNFVVPNTSIPATTDFLNVDVYDVDRGWDTAPYIKAYDINGVFLGQVQAIAQVNGGTWFQNLTVDFQGMHRLELYHEDEGANGWDNFIFNTPQTFINTPSGSNVTVAFPNGASVNYGSVASECSTYLTTMSTPSHNPPPNFRFVRLGYFDISTDCSYTGPVIVVYPYDEAEIRGQEQNLKLFHWKNNGWDDCTVSVDTVNNTITGRVNSLSPFGIGY